MADDDAVDHRRLEPLAKFCRGEGCPQADLCRRYMETEDAEEPSFFRSSPLFPDGQCGEFVATGGLRAEPLVCGGAHPPPLCSRRCQIEVHRWERRGDGWTWIGGAEN